MKSLRICEQFRCGGPASLNATRLDAISQHLSESKRRPKSITTRCGRVIDVYVRPHGEDLGGIADSIDQIIADTEVPKGSNVTLRGMVQGMRAPFQSFASGLMSGGRAAVPDSGGAIQNRFVDPLIILLAVPPGLDGCSADAVADRHDVECMSLMGVVMLTGIAVSNSILIVEFTRHLREEGMAVREAVAIACRVRLRPVLMTSLATIIGLMPMAMKLGEGSEAYAPLARAIIGGLACRWC